jgi:hypothetical protein
MNRGTGPLTIAALLLIGWGALSCFFFPGADPALPPAAVHWIRLHRVTAGILTVFAGVVLLHLPSLLRRGEYQAMRLLSISVWFLAGLALWLGRQSPGRTLVDYVPAAVFGVCALLVLIASLSARRGLRLPRI